MIGVGGRGCCLPGLLPPRLCPNPLPAGAPGDRSQLAHGPPARPAGWPGRRWRPGWAGGPAGLVLDRHGPEMGIQAPFRGFLDAILDQICRTRLKKVKTFDCGPQKGIVGHQRSKSRRRFNIVSWEMGIVFHFNDFRARRG